VTFVTESFDCLFNDPVNSLLLLDIAQYYAGLKFALSGRLI